jgi:hypothetical protein
MANDPTPGRLGTSSRESVTQLRLLPGRAGRREWVLDERTRAVGRHGVAQAREILRQHRPPQPVDEFSKAS